MNIVRNTVVIHHNKDLDGFTSGAICRLKFPLAELIGWDYKDPIPDLQQFADKDVILIDISFPMEQMSDLAMIAKSVTWIDHHISAFKDYTNSRSVLMPGLEKIKYVYGTSAACELGWDYFFPDRPIPPAVQLLGMYDTWREFGTSMWDQQILPFQYYARLVCTSPETFPGTWFFDIDDAQKYLSEAIDTGAYIVEYQKEQDRLACQRSAFEATVGGRPAICLNTRFFSSLTMKSVYDPSKHDLMVGFEYTGTKWSVSLRSDKPDVDVSVIAKSKGGGGHKAAAGFECDNFEDIFK